MPSVNLAQMGDASAERDGLIPAAILAVIAAAAFMFVCKRLRIRSVKLLSSPREQVNRWSRQGRALVQSSHNLAVKHIAKAK
jgi:hypothetical protein